MGFPNGWFDPTGAVQIVQDAAHWDALNKAMRENFEEPKTVGEFGCWFQHQNRGIFSWIFDEKKPAPMVLPMGIWYDIMVYIIEIYRDMIFIYLKFCLILFRFLLIYYIRMMGHTHNGMQLKKCIGSSPILVARINAHVFLSITGWWFGTFFIFPYIGKNNPNWLYFSEGLKPPTR